MKKLILLIIGITITTICFAATDPMGPALIRARIKPVGQVNIATSAVTQATPAPTTAATADTGKHIYETKCVVCHATGVAGAPKLGDKAIWSPRIATGIKTLLDHVKNGYKAMPPKGTCTDCSDADLQAAINYMIKQAK